MTTVRILEIWSYNSSFASLFPSDQNREDLQLMSSLSSAAEFQRRGDDRQLGSVSVWGCLSDTLPGAIFQAKVAPRTSQKLHRGRLCSSVQLLIIVGGTFPKWNLIIKRSTHSSKKEKTKNIRNDGDTKLPYQQKVNFNWDLEIIQLVARFNAKLNVVLICHWRWLAKNNTAGSLHTGPHDCRSMAAPWRQTKVG